jgi:flagellar biogenesis protein FliO
MKPEYIEPKDTPGASSSTDRPRISAIKVIKVEMEQKDEEYEVEQFLVTLTAALGLSLAVQWVFGKRTKCAKRNNQPSKTEAQVNTLKIQDSESSEKFELISNRE